MQATERSFVLKHAWGKGDHHLALDTFGSAHQATGPRLEAPDGAGALFSCRATSKACKACKACTCPTAAPRCLVVWPQGEETHHVAVIMSNPDQSKHLETARMKIRGVWIDLVNLRSETYTQHSRIPTMEVGKGMTKG